MPWFSRKTRNTSSSISPARYWRTPSSNLSSSSSTTGSRGRVDRSFTSMAMSSSERGGGSRKVDRGGRDLRLAVPGPKYQRAGREYFPESRVVNQVPERQTHAVPARRLSRRAFLGRSAALGGAVALSRLGWPAPGAWAGKPKPVRPPGSLPHPKLPVGTETLPKIDHIVVVMMENHSYDNYLGMLGRGDGFELDRGGHPTAANPDDDGNLVRAFRMPSTCQLERAPGQNWNASHIQYDDGRNDGFVRASGPVSMGYWTKDDLPFYYGLARTFPLCDRWFGSCLGQTYPNRRFLLAGTAHGLVSTDVSKILAPSPPNGLILDQLNAHGISWRNYYSDP